jgi:hypothetical protein
VTTLHLKSAATIKVHEGSLRDFDGQLARSQGVAFLSAKGWADEAGTNPPDFYGDGVYTEGDEKGHLPVVAVSEFGRGRVAVMGDQNMHGDAWLHFRHNFRQASNTIDWLLEPSFAAISNPPPRPPLPLRATPLGFTIGFDVRHRPYTAAKKGPDDYYAFFCNLNRDHGVTARAVALGERKLTAEGGGCRVGDTHSTNVTHEGKEDKESIEDREDGQDGRVELEKDIVDDDDDGSFSLRAIILPPPLNAVAPSTVQQLRRMSQRGTDIIMFVDVLDCNKHGWTLLNVNTCMCMHAYIYAYTHIYTHIRFLCTRDNDNDSLDVTPFRIRVFSYCHIVILSYCHIVILSYCHRPWRLTSRCPLAHVHSM